MKRFVVILGSIFLFGSTMKIWDIPGSIILMGISSTLLSWIYLLFSYFLLNEKRFRDIFKKNTYFSIDAYRAIVSIIAGWSISAFIMGVLFLVMNWAGGVPIFITGIVWLLGCSVILLIRMKRQKEFAVTCFKHILVAISVGLVALIEVLVIARL